MSNRPGNTRRITKAEILAGPNAIEHVYIEALDADVPIRRLTSRQKAQVESVKTRGIVVKVNDPGMLDDVNARDMDGMSVDLDLETLTKAEHEAQMLAVHYGLALDERVSMDDVDAIDPQAVEQIAREIYRISGVKENDRRSLATFRG